MSLHPSLEAVTARISARSADSRAAYLQRVAAAASRGPRRSRLDCGNLAHAYAACGEDKPALKGERAPNLGIVTAYNDMLSAHQPFETYPGLIKEAARQAGGTAQVAGGVPAMCDGVTQGQPGMELSLFSRDLIAMSTGVALSHDVFDAAVLLGVCDKIVPGLLIGALAFGHLPALLVPAGPMTSGSTNDDKRRHRELFAQGLIDRATLLDSESRAYHGPGTCTFYGTANSNQMLMELMGLHVPGGTFVNPGTPLREALTREAAARALAITALGPDYTPLAEVVDTKAIVNGMVGLLATGGSTNHALHIVAIAAAAGLVVDWDDLSALSAVVPLCARVYPNGGADVNHFQAAGGLGVLIGGLLDHGLLHPDSRTIWGTGLADYRVEAFLGPGGQVLRRPSPSESQDKAVLRDPSDPFDSQGGLSLLQGNLGRAVIKTSAVHPSRHRIQAPARVFDSQEDVMAAFSAGQLEEDFIAVLRFQGPRANGMPELHKLTPALSVLQDRGHRVALVTDGRMSGASGKVPSAIHISPEAALGGPLARVRDGDLLLLDATEGRLEAMVPEAVWAARVLERPDPAAAGWDTGRALFQLFRDHATPAERGGGVLNLLPEAP
jgi:phosphogluconate dehydratase